jgi:Tetratricopeptide repeat
VNNRIVRHRYALLARGATPRAPRAALGPDHPDVAVRLGNLAVIYRDLGRAGDALPLEKRAEQLSQAFR